MMTRARSWLAAALLLGAAASLSAQATADGPARFDLSFSPGMTVPVAADLDAYKLGAAGDLRWRMILPFLPWCYAGADLQYTYSPLRRNDSLSIASLGAELGLAWQMVPGKVELSAFGGGGYFIGTLNGGGGIGSNPDVTGGLGLSVILSPELSVGLSGTYRGFLGLYNDVLVAAATSYHFGGTVNLPKPKPRVRIPEARPAPLGPQEARPGTGLQLGKVSLSDVYPVFYKFYDDHPLGAAVLHNYDRAPITDAKLSVFVKEYMSEPKEAAVAAAVAPGADASVDLYGLFTKQILANTETTKVSARVTLTYTMDGQAYSQSQVQTLQVLKRNSLTWDDDRKVAAFVSANDPTAAKFAKNVQSMVRGKASPAIDPNLLLVMAVHEALTLYGLTYSTDPVATLNSDNKTVDYIQFPQQTLDYKGGKCSDFSVLYASLMEALGVQTAFITIPGHIFMAVALATPPDEVQRTLANPDDFIYKLDKAWLPVEITLRDGGFLKAWQLGAREYRESLMQDEAAFFTLRDAWKLYQPVGYSSEVTAIPIPADAAVASAYRAGVEAFVAAQIQKQEAALLAAAAKPASRSKSLNSLAVLYSRFGLYDKAAKALDQVLAKDEYLPSLVNRGNVCFVQQQNDKALAFYTRAFRKDPNNPTVLLCVARANQALENYAAASDAFARLQARDPSLAAQYPYLSLRGDEATRAANAAGTQGRAPWME
jgi:tetratricopeptide (TPR) repeat protein